jgi:CRISPR-associated protein Csd1
MILQSLYNYYQILSEDQALGIAEPGYSNAPVSYAINLSLQGNLLDIIPLYVPVQQGKKTLDRPRRMNVPEQVKRAGISPKPNFMCDYSAFVLGVPEQKEKDTQYGSKRFEAFRKHNIEILSKVDSPTARAVMAFLQKHNPRKAKEDPLIARHLESLVQGSNLIFQVEGKDALSDEKIRRAWEDYALGQEALEMQCLVTGEIEPIARLHPDIKGVRDAQTKGASLVSFNLNAFTSYGRDQGSNSPVSRRVASGYGVALNYLLSNQNPNRKIHLGDTTVVYWADTPDKRYASAFYNFLNPEYQQEQVEETEEAQGKGKRKRAKEAERTLGEAAESVQQGKAIDLVALREGLDKNTRFYVLGLAPSAARLAVRFFLTEPFGVFAERIMQHYKDLEIEKEYANQPTYLSPYRILAECVSPKVSKRDEEVKKSWSLLGGAFMRAILTGAPYPEGLYTAIINRIRHDSDEEKEDGRKRNVKINYVRAAFIKAHLIRKYRRQGINLYKEALQMSLNESYTHPAYVLGRLFAWLERAQREALGKNINATIKDRYFTSACATPASVFPTIMRLSHHWTGKAEYGTNLEKNMQAILDLLEAKPFPSHLTLDEQGVFVLGYYHQRAAFYPKKGNSAEEAARPEE